MINYWHWNHKHWFRWICRLRKKHREIEEYGGGADCIICGICDAVKVLRYYNYGEDKPKRDEVENPTWVYFKKI